MTNSEHEMWDNLHISYEHAYLSNPFKKACIAHAISLLKPSSRVLDVGCGTGVPVSQMLAEAGMEVVGIDVAPNMVEHARRRVMGEFEMADMVGYTPEGRFEGVFVVYSQLGMSYVNFHAAAWKLAQALEPGGLFVIGQSAADSTVPKEDPAWDGTRSYVEGYNLPFWGEPFATLMFSRAGQRAFLESMGLEIVYDTLDVFQPENEKCDAEHQQYIIARRQGKRDVMAPQPLPESKS